MRIGQEQSIKTVRILTFNTFLLDVNLAARKTSAQRLPLIAPEIARLEPDVIMLQEVWGESYRKYLRHALAERGWRYSSQACAQPTPCASTKLAGGFAAVGSLSATQVARTSRWNRRAFIGAAAGSMFLAGSAAYAARTLRDYGNGLLIVSRWPIVETAAMSFRTYSRLDEALVYKGAVRARVVVPDAGPIDVVNTHLGARTYDLDRGAYSPVTVRANDQQVDELTEWLRTGAGAAGGVVPSMIVAGDLNFNPWVVSGGKITERRSPGYGKLVDPEPEGLGLIDTYAAVHGTSVGGFTGGTATGYGAPPAGETRAKPPERIDYIFTSKTVRVKSSNVVLNDRLPERGDGERWKRELGIEAIPLHVSDHFGLLSAVELPTNDSGPARPLEARRPGHEMGRPHSSSDAIERSASL